VRDTNSPYRQIVAEQQSLLSSSDLMSCIAVLDVERRREIQAQALIASMPVSDTQYTITVNDSIITLLLHFGFQFPGCVHDNHK